MKIILWAPYGAGTHYWGPGTSAFRLYKNLNDRNIQVTLIHATDYQDDFPEVFYEQIKIGSIDDKKTTSILLFLIKSLLWLYKNRKNYDVLHGITAFYYTFIPSVFFSKLGGKVFIKITGGNGGFGSNSKISNLIGLTKFRETLANSISGYISISSFISNNLLTHGITKDKVFYIPNGVNTKLFHPITSSEKIKLRKKHKILDKFTFVYVGGLTPNKRILNIIEAMSILKKSGYSTCQLLIVGPDRSNGLIEKEINDRVDKLDILEQVVRRDFTEQPELFYQMSDAFILVSQMEGMSNSLLEAMSCGLPAIVTKISGSEDLINDEFNGLFTDGTSEDIANCMMLFIEEKIDIKQMKLNTRARIEKKHSDAAILNKHIRLFKNVN